MATRARTPARPLAAEAPREPAEADRDRAAPAVRRPDRAARRRAPPERLERLAAPRGRRAQAERTQAAEATQPVPRAQTQADRAQAASQDRVQEARAQEARPRDRRVLPARRDRHRAGPGAGAALLGRPEQAARRPRARRPARRAPVSARPAAPSKTCVVRAAVRRAMCARSTSASRPAPPALTRATAPRPSSAISRSASPSPPRRARWEPKFPAESACLGHPSAPLVKAAPARSPVCNRASSSRRRSRFSRLKRTLGAMTGQLRAHRIAS